MAYIIATVAEKGAGKGLFASIVQKLCVPRRVAVIRFSDPLREILKILGKEESREKMDTLVTALREGFHDQGVLISVIKQRLTTKDADIVVLDGVRKSEEASFIKSKLPIINKTKNTQSGIIFAISRIFFCILCNHRARDI